MNEKIKHSGVVESVDGDCMKVRILQTSACAGCKAASFCNAAEKKEKIVDVYGSLAMGGHKAGDSVIVTASQSTGRRAVLIGFGLPLLILVAALVITYSITHSEPLAALVSIVALIPYYLGIYFCREHLRRDFSFAIEN